MRFKEYLKIIYRWFFRGQKSYSQLGEDLILNFFLSDIKKGVYVDIGANNPVYLNNTYFFYKKGWSGLCIEPNSLNCKLLKSVRPRDEVLNVGLGKEKAELNFYVLEPDQLSTFSKNEAERVNGLGHKIVQVKKIPVCTLAEVLQNFNKPIDLLSIDTEGMDLEILQSNNWEHFRPKFILAEVAEYHGKKAVRTNKMFDSYLREKGYLKLADTFINAIYVEKQYASSHNLKDIEN
jgi:FkbM family methyltransferase